MNVIKSFNELLEKSKKIEDASKNIRMLIKILNGVDKNVLSKYGLVD